MKRNGNINEEVEQAMQSLDGLQPATANPFLYTRIMQRMKNRVQDKTYGSQMFRLAMVLLIFIAINVFTYDKFAGSNTSDNKTGVEAFASDYGLQLSEDNI